MFKPSQEDMYSVRRKFATYAFANLWLILIAIFVSAALGFPLKDYISILVALIGADTTIIGYYFTTVHFDKKIDVDGSK